MAIILMMGFFIAGYLFYIYSLYKQIYFPQQLIIGLVFFVGACFVYLVVKITRTSLQALLDANKELEHETTVRLKAEEELYRSRRLEALGTLTGGIAHEFNNILTAIIGYGEFIQDAVPKESEAGKYSDMIISSASRAAKLTESLLTYSRKQITHTETLDMNHLLVETEHFLNSFIGRQATLMLAPAPEPLMVQADRSQLEHAFVNLASNAVDALPNGGLLKFSLERILFSGPTAFQEITIPPGGYALLHVEDTGSGISKEDLEKIFEPFFTTKGVGKGTGLGLSVVYGIVKRHGGFITVRSELNRGTHVSIYLPLAELEMK